MLFSVPKLKCKTEQVEISRTAMEPGSGSFPTKYVCALKRDTNYLPVHYKNIQRIYHNLE